MKTPLSFRPSGSWYGTRDEVGGEALPVVEKAGHAGKVAADDAGGVDARTFTLPRDG